MINLDRLALVDALSEEERAVLIREKMRRFLIPFLVRCMTFLYPGEVFEENWHHSAMAHVLRQIETGEVRRLIINVPPRYLKSQMVSVAFVAFMLGRHPERKFPLCQLQRRACRQAHARLRQDHALGLVQGAVP